MCVWAAVVRLRRCARCRLVVDVGSRQLQFVQAVGDVQEQQSARPSGGITWTD